MTTVVLGKNSKMVIGLAERDLVQRYRDVLGQERRHVEVAAVVEGGSRKMLESTYLLGGTKTSGSSEEIAVRLSARAADASFHPR